MDYPEYRDLGEIGNFILNTGESSSSTMGLTIKFLLGWKFCLLMLSVNSPKSIRSLGG